MTSAHHRTAEGAREAQARDASPRLLFVAPALGTTPGWVVSQAETLERLFRRDGYDTSVVSRYPQPARRAADTVISTLAWRDRYDVAIVAVFSGKGFAIADAATAMLRRLRKPIVLALRGGDLPRFHASHGRWVSRVLQRADRIMAPSPYLAEYFGRCGFSVDVVPNVVDLDLYPFRLREAVGPRLLWMRTFHHHYNPHLAVDVVDLLCKRGIPATLTMGGQDAGLRAEVMASAQAKGIGDQVKDVGFLGPERKIAALQEHDVFLNTNRVDNMPVTVVEALACGLPTVATEVGGIPYLLTHEETALLVPDDDAAATAAAVERLLTTPALAERLSRQGRALAEESAWPAVKRQLETIFREVIS